MALIRTIFMYFGFIFCVALSLWFLYTLLVRIYEKRFKGKVSKKSKKYKTYTKKWLTIILINGIIWVYLSYILAFLGREQIAETLSVQAIISIIATIIGYFAKSAFEKKIGKEKEENEGILEENYQ